MAKKYSQICLSKPAFRGRKLRILQQFTQQVGHYKSNFFWSNYVTKNLVDFFRCAFIELWVHLGRLRMQKSSEGEFRVQLRSFPRASITPYTSILNWKVMISTWFSKQFKLDSEKWFYSQWPGWLRKLGNRSTSNWNQTNDLLINSSGLSCSRGG